MSIDNRDSESSNIRVMFIDDEPALLETVEQLLHMLGFSVHGFDNPENAWHAFISQPDDYDIIVTDNAMQDFSGLDFLQRIRTHGFSTPVIIFSGSDIRASKAHERSDAKDGKVKYTPDAYLLKPVQITELVEQIKQVLNK